MKIVREGESMMVLKERMILPRIVGVIFVTFGLLSIFKPEIFTENPPDLWAAVFIVLGLLAIFLSKSVTIILDKNANQMTIRKRSLLGRKLQVYMLNAVNRIELRKSWNTANSGNNAQSSVDNNLVFMFNTGEEVVFNLGSYSLKVMGRSINIRNSIGTRIANFLGVPFGEMRPPSLQEALSTIYSAVRDAAEQHNSRIDLEK